MAPGHACGCACVAKRRYAVRQSAECSSYHFIISDDHGLAVGSHGLRGKQNMYEHTVGTPLIWRGPGIPKGQRTNAQCYLRDLYPTICELVGIDVPPTVQGHSLVPVIRGERESVYSCVFGHFKDAQRMIRTDRWKLIRYPKIDKFQLFDLANDPCELNNLAENPAHAVLMKQLCDRLRAWQKDVGDPAMTAPVGSVTVQ